VVVFGRPTDQENDFSGKGEYAAMLGLNKSFSVIDEILKTADSK
jgi:hypothetical protein